MSIENLKGSGVKFGEGQPTDKGGRPKKIYTVLKEMGFSKDDVNTCFGELLWYDEKQLLKVYSDSSKPIITHITAKALLEAKKSGNISYIKEILEQVIGKPTQNIVTETKEALTSVTIKEAE